MMNRAEYNFFKLNASGLIDTVAVLKLDDDRTALSHARAMHHSQPIEVWKGRRQIGFVPAVTDRRGMERRAA